MENEKKLNVVVKLVQGSHLYGTVSKTSDKDFKGVYIPTLKDIILKKDKDVINFNTNNSDNKNTSEDVDVEYYSLYKFLQLCRKGETVAIDMLHSPDSAIILKTPLWDLIRKNRSRFYTTRISAFLGYCKSQAVKYGEKGNRLEALENVIEILKTEKRKYLKGKIYISDDFKLREIWNSLPENQEYYFKSEDDYGVWYNVLDKKFLSDNYVNYALEQIESIKKKYGKRVQLAKENKGVDWKAISHAFRFGYQLEELFTTGDIQFPLKEKKFIKSVKYGEFDYVKDNIAQKLEDLINKVMVLVDKNERKFPETVDFDYWEKVLFSTHFGYPNDSESFQEIMREKFNSFLSLKE